MLQIPGLRRLDLPQTELTGWLNDLSRRPVLTSVSGKLNQPGEGKVRRPAEVGRSALRELRITSGSEWKSESPLRWLRGLGELRVLSLDLYSRIRCEDLELHPNLQVLELDALVDCKGAAPKLAQLGFLSGYSLPKPEEAATPVMSLRGFTALRSLEIRWGDLRGARAQVLAQAPHLRRLRCFGCQTDDATLGNHITGAGDKHQSGVLTGQRERTADVINQQH